jgi:hypothetical protein
MGLENKSVAFSVAFSGRVIPRREAPSCHPEEQSDEGSLPFRQEILRFAQDDGCAVRSLAFLVMTGRPFS